MVKIIKAFETIQVASSLGMLKAAKTKRPVPLVKLAVPANGMAVVGTADVAVVVAIAFAEFFLRA